MELGFGADDVDAACGDVDDEERGEGHEALRCPDLRGEEVGRRKGVPVSAEELRPCGPLRALGCGLDAVVLQDPLDGVVGDLVSHVLEGALDASVAPAAVFPGHLDDQLRDLGHHAMPAS